MSITQQDVFQAQHAIRAIARRTPLVPAEALSALTGAQVRLKLETLQETGAFKVRGAANRLLALTPEERARGVVAVSTGNHGRAVAHVCRRLGIQASICVSERVPPNKVRMLEQTGASLVIHGQSQDEAEERATALIAEHGLTMIHPFDDPLIIAGQGTIGLEILTNYPQVDTVLVPLSGGGLISGIAVALKAANPAIRMIGISMEEGAVMYYSLRANRPLQMPEADTLADSLNGGIGLENRYTYELVRRYVDEVILVPEEAIADAMAFTLREHHLVVEGAGAVGIAALMRGQVKPMGRHLVVVLSGGNVDLALALRIAQERA
jgi:threonine dehydratase